jgi:bacterioferritin (cytochrome b1)
LGSRIPDYVSRVEALTSISHCYLIVGQVEPVLEHLNEAEKISDRYSVYGDRFNTRFSSKVRIGYAWAHLLAAEMAGTRERKFHLENALQASKQARRSVQTFILHRSEAFRLQGTCDWLQSRERQARQWWEKSLAMATEIGQPYELAMTYMEMGDRLEEADYLKMANKLLEEIGARPYLLKNTP